MSAFTAARGVNWELSIGKVGVVESSTRPMVHMKLEVSSGPVELSQPYKGLLRHGQAGERRVPCRTSRREPHHLLLEVRPCKEKPHTKPRTFMARAQSFHATQTKGE